MSHFTKIKTKLKDEKVLISTLENLGYGKNIKKGSLVKDYRRNKLKVDFSLEIESSNNIGFLKTSNGSFDIITDWWGVNGINKNEFIRNVKQKYSLEIIKREMAKKGYNIVEEKSLEDKSIKIVVRKW